MGFSGPGGSGGLESTAIDTYNELNTIVADATLTHNGLIDTIAELNAIVGDATIVVQGGDLGTPSAGVGTNLTGTAAGLTAGAVTTNANLTGHVTSVGNAAVLGSFTLAQLNTAISDNTVDAAGTDNSTDVTLAGTGTYISIVGQVITVDPITESDISDLQSYLLNVVEDTTPQLGGSLDVNGNKIVSTSDGNIDIEPNGTGNVLLGNFTFDADQTVGAGQDNYVLTYDDGTGLISLEAASGGAEVNDLTASVTWANVPDANITESSVTQHEAAIDHDALTNFVANEHIDWTGDAGASNIHVNNITAVPESAVTAHEAALSIEGTAIASTGEAGGTKFLREDGDGTSSWQAIAGGGDLLAANNLSDVDSATTSATNLGLGTGDSPQFTAIEMGHASDTTIARSGAGVITIEGVEVATVSATQTLTNKTIDTASNTITVVEADISDLQSYLTAETNDLSAAVTWANVPDANITESSVTQHEAALSIEGTAIASTGEGGGSKFLREDGDGTCSWQEGGSGDTSKVGTPTDGEVAIWTGDGTLGKDDDQNANSTLTYDGADLEHYQAVNDSTPRYRVGFAAGESASVQAFGATGTQTLEFVDFVSTTASGTADYGAFRFKPDGVLIVTIDDDAVNIASGKALEFDGTTTLTGSDLSLAANGTVGFGGVTILTDTSGTTTLSNIDALDATTEATIEAAIDTLANLTAAAALVTVGTVTTGNVDAVVSAASTTTAGKIEVATAAEINTGTDAARAVSPDTLAGSNFGTVVVSIIIFDDSEDNATGDGAGDIWWRVPSTVGGMDLVGVAACVQTAGTTGTVDIQIHNVTQAADMLTTKITIDSSETDSSTAATAAVIDTANDDVATGDQIRFDVDAIHTTPAKGLLIELQFRLP